MLKVKLEDLRAENSRLTFFGIEKVVTSIVISISKGQRCSDGENCLQNYPQA
jgi:hypothetical protein